MLTGTEPQVSIASLNIKGLGIKKKREDLNNLLKGRDVIALQEAHGTKKLQFKFGLSFPGYVAYWSHYKSNSRGVVTLVSKSIHSKLIDTDEDGRLVAVELFEGPARLLLINVYAPVHSQTHVYKASYSRLLQKASQIMERHTAQHKIICGDWNTTWQHQTDAEAANVYPYRVPKELIENLNSGHDLVNVYRSREPDKREVSFIPFGNSKNCVARLLDHAFATPGFTNTVRKVKHTFTHLSDHKILEITTKNAVTNARAKLWRHKDDLLYDEEYRQGLLNAIEEFTNAKELEELADDRSRW